MYFHCFTHSYLCVCVSCARVCVLHSLTQVVQYALRHIVNTTEITKPCKRVIASVMKILMAHFDNLHKQMSHVEYGVCIHKCGYMYILRL